MPESSTESALVLDDLAWKDLAAIAEEYLRSVGVVAVENLTLAWGESGNALATAIDRRVTLAKRIIEVA